MPLVLALAAAATIQPRIIDRRDPIDDVRSALVLLERGKTALAVGCLNVADRSTITVFAKFERIVGRQVRRVLAGGTPVQYRFDQQPHHTESWSSQRYIVRNSGSFAMRFLLAMKGSQQVYMRAQKADRDILQISFTYSDPTRMIDDVLGRCGFNPDGSPIRQQGLR